MSSSIKTRIKHVYMNPLVSVLIINWNGKHYLEDCLTSLYNQTYKNFEVIVFDNGSVDGSVEFVKSRFPDVHIIKNKENIGFAGGNNIAFKNAKGDFIALLNNDTKVDILWLEELIKVMQSSKKIGICTAKVLRMGDPSIIDSTGLIFKSGFPTGRGYSEKDTGQYDKQEEVWGATGTAVLLRREMINKIGLFDETFFAYCEDIDLSWRARNAGWKTVYVPTSICYHVSGGTSKNFKIQELIEKNKARTLCKNAEAYLIYRFIIEEFILMIKSYVGFVIGRNNIGYSPYWKALKILFACKKYINYNEI